MFDLMLNTAIVGAAIAAGYWFLRQQTIHKGFGLTLHWWAPVDLVAGFAISTIAMAGIFLTEWLLGGIRVVGVQWNPSLPSAFIQWGGTAAFEELVSRSGQLPGLQVGLALVLAIVATRLPGTWQDRMDVTMVWSAWPALLLIAAFFGWAHLNNDGASPVTAFGNALGGLMYGIAFFAGRNLWLPIGMHWAWNFAQGSIFGFPVSGTAPSGLITQEVTGSTLLTGGAYGPEGGLVGMAFRFVVIGLVIGYVYLRAGRQGDWARLEFPIAAYANPPGSRRPLFGKRAMVPSGSRASTV